MPALQVQVWLWRVSLRQLWSSSGGHEHTGRRGCAALLGAAVVAGLAAVLAQVGLAGVDGVLPVTVVLPWVSAVAILVFAGATLAALCSMTDDYPVRQALAALPLADGAILLGAVAPVVVALLLGGGLLVPAISAGVVALTGAGAGAVWPTVAGSVGLGLAAGLILSAGARSLVRVLGGSRGSVYPAGIVGLGALGLGVLACLRATGPTGMWWRDVVVPGSASSVASRAPGGVPVVAAIALAGALAVYCYAVPSDLGRPGESRPLVVWSPRGPWPLLWLEVVRLARQPRLVGSLAAVHAVALAGFWWLSRSVEPAIRADVLGAVLTVFAAALVHPFLLLRGYSAVPYPAQVLLGQPVLRWLSRLAGACALLVSIPVLLLVLVAAGPWGSPAFAMFAAGVSLLGAGLGLAVGVVRPLGPGAVAVETGLLMATGLLLYAALVGMGQLVSTPASLGCACLVAGVGAFAVAGAAERRRGVL